MLPISNINQVGIQFQKSNSDRQLQKEQQNSMEGKDNQIKDAIDCCDNLGIQIKNQNQKEETIQNDSYNREIQFQEVINRSQFENQRHGLDSSSISESQIADETNKSNIKIQIFNQQVAMNSRDVEIQKNDKGNTGDQIEKNQVTLINFEDDNNNREVKKQIQDKEQQQQQENLGLNNSQFKDNNNICPICSLNPKNIIKVLECEHQFCGNCYKEYLEYKIKIAKINNILCLQDGCKITFSEEIIKQFVSEQKFQQYLDFKRKHQIENDPNKKWCPAKGCNLFIEKDPKTNLVYCQCGQIVCFNCGQYAHNGLLCEDAIQIDFKQALVKYQIKYCPKCKSHIQKNSGCNHMTCIQCQFQFCWICLQQYHEQHYKYWSIRGCAIWSNGRFKTSNLIQNPDKMRIIYFFPRLILYILRCPLLIIKLILKSTSKSLIKPLVGLNKKLCRSEQPKFCLFKCLYFLLAELLILLIVIIIFPFYFVFYRLGKEIYQFSTKGCAY